MTLIYTRKTKLTLNNVDEFIPHLERYFESFKCLTPELRSRIETEILIHANIKGNVFEILKKTLRLGSGSLKQDKMKFLLGWNDEELKIHSEYMSKRQISKLVKMGKTEEDAKKEYAKQQAKGSKRSIEYWITEGYSEEDAKINLSEYQSSATKKHKASLSESEYSDFKKRSSKRCKEHWMTLGYTEEDAKKEIIKLQSKVSKRCIEYWISLGYTENEAIKAVSDYQKSSLDNKTQEEIVEINKKKYSGFSFKAFGDEKYMNTPGMFYIIWLNDNLCKIGITTKFNINERYQRKDLESNGNQVLLEHQCNNIIQAFEIEQIMLNDFKHNIHKDDYGPFGWTEVIHTNIEDVQNKFNHYINNRDEVKRKFRALRKKNEDNPI